MCSCGEDTSPNDQDCPTELFCTEEFRTITFSPMTIGFIILDSYYSQNLDNGKTYNFGHTGILPQDEFYVIITDGQMEEIEKEGTTIRFFGLINNQIVIEQDFLIGHDCCHVITIEGPSNNQ